MLIVPVYALVVFTNYFVDPANIFHASMTDKICEGLKEYEAVEVVGDFDEGSLLEKRIASFSTVPSVMVMGSSHVLYVDWDFDDYQNIGMSGEFLDDYYATVGLLNKYNKIPKTLVIGVDPYIFMDGLSIRQDSLSMYAADVKNMLNPSSYGRVKPENAKLKRIKELFSFSYFQSSAEALLHKVDASYVNPVSDPTIGDYPKILQNGRRVPSFSSYMAIEDMESASEWDVSNKAVYCMVDYETLDATKISEFEYLIDFLISKNVNVILYLSSWYPVYYDEFSSNVKFSGVLKAEDYLREMAGTREIEVRGSYSPYECGIEREDFLDYFHLTPEGGLKNYSVIIK